jgi:hypothetical protein
MRKYQLNTSLDSEGALYGIAVIFTGETEESMVEIGGFQAYKTEDGFRTEPKSGESYQAESINATDRHVISTMMDDIMYGTISGGVYTKIVE